MSDSSTDRAQSPDRAQDLAPGVDRAQRIDAAQPYALSLFRIVVGLLFTCHGVASLFGVLGKPELSAGLWPGWYAALIQLVCGVLVLFGLVTRPAALVGSGSMAFAYFDVHQRHALLPIQNGGEAAVFFCWTLLLIVFCGPGVLALDRLVADRRASAQGAREAQAAQAAQAVQAVQAAQERGSGGLAMPA